MPKYVKVILPLRLAFEPWYKTGGLQLSPGDRVKVLFSGKEYTGVVSDEGGEPDIDPKRILRVLGKAEGLEPITPEELKLWRFTSDYYLHTIGEVYKAAYPEEKTSGEKTALRNEARRQAREEKERSERESRLTRLKERLEKKERSLQGKHNESVTARLEAERDDILKAIDRLEDTSRNPEPPETGTTGPVTGKPRTSAVTKGLMKALSAGKPVLMRDGVRRHKTIAEAAAVTLHEGKCALILTPEKDRSGKMEKILRKTLGDSLVVFNSSMTGPERRAAIKRVRSAEPPVAVLGTRSAVFLPFRNLGLVVIDDEQDTSHKSPAAPRHNARDVATVLGTIHGAGIVLASASPSLETTLNARTGKYTLYAPADARDITIETISSPEEALKRGLAGGVSLKITEAVRKILNGGGKALVLTPWGDTDRLAEIMSVLLGKGTDTKGLKISTVRKEEGSDLSGYDIVALVKAERLETAGDFRSDERAAQTIARLKEACEGKLMIQTSRIVTNIYNPTPDFENTLLLEREHFGYPPYSRMVEIRLEDKSEKRLAYMSSVLSEKLKAYNATPPGRLISSGHAVEDTMAIRVIIPKDKRLGQTKREILRTVSSFENEKRYQGHIKIDVDPV